MKRTVCAWFVGIFIALYAGAVAILLVGTCGLFDQPRDPLSGIFLIPLGLPWNLWLDSAPDAALPWLAVLAPGLNGMLLWFLCRAHNRS